MILARAATVSTFIGLVGLGCSETQPIDNPLCAPMPEVLVQPMPLSPQEVSAFVGPISSNQACLGITDPNCLLASQRAQNIYTETLESMLPEGMTRDDFEEGRVAFSIFRGRGTHLNILFGEAAIEFVERGSSTFDDEDCPEYQLEPVDKSSYYLTSSWGYQIDAGEGIYFQWDGSLYDGFDAIHDISRRLVSCSLVNTFVEDGAMYVNSIAYFLAMDDITMTHRYKVGIPGQHVVGSCPELFEEGNVPLADNSTNYECLTADACGGSEAIEEFQLDAETQYSLLDNFDPNVIYRYEP